MLSKDNVPFEMPESEIVELPTGGIEKESGNCDVELPTGEEGDREGIGELRRGIVDLEFRNCVEFHNFGERRVFRNWTIIS